MKGALECSFFIIFRKQIYKLSVKFLFSNHSLMLVVICYTWANPSIWFFTKHALLYCEIPSSEFKVKMERTKFYEILHKKALECATSGDLT